MFQIDVSVPNMAAILAGNNVEQEYLWACTLTGSNKEYKWSPEDEDKKDEEEVSLKASHRLLVKSAILMPSSKKDEVSIVQIECDGYNKQKVIVPICAMKGGQDLQKYVDLLVPCTAKISLLQGEGPIHLIGSHCVDFYGYKDVDEDEDDNDEATADEDAAEDEAMEEEVKGDKASPAKEGSGSTKRKASSDPPKSDEKKKKASPAK